MEDLLIFTDTWADHVQAVERVLQAASEHDISFNPDKVQFGLRAVKFGGFVLTKGHYEIDPELTDDLRNFPAPTNRTQLRSFLGLAQQIGGFTADLARLVEPLRDLNTDKTKWHWLDHHQAAFEQARAVLASPAHLHYFDPARRQSSSWMPHDSTGWASC